MCEMAIAHVCIIMKHHKFNTIMPIGMQLEIINALYFPKSQRSKGSKI